MGMDLFRRGGSMSLNWEAWRELLSLAEVFGWRPTGTIANPDPGDPFVVFSRPESDDAIPSNQLGTYFSNDGNLVTSADAGALADALEIALGRPEQPPVKRFLEPSLLEFEVEGKGKVIFENSGDDIREMTREFIEFCRAGRFIVL